MACKFKIRCKGTQLYSTGGVSPKWTHKGREYSRKALALKDIEWYRMNQNPLLSISDDSIDFYEEAEIVKFQLVWTEREVHDVRR